MTTQVESDERSMSISHAGGYYAYLVMCWLLVLSLAIRSWRPELMSLQGLPADILCVLAGGAVTHLGYKLWWQATGRRSILAILFSLSLATIAALVATSIFK